MHHFLTLFYAPFIFVQITLFDHVVTSFRRRISIALLASSTMGHTMVFSANRQPPAKSTKKSSADYKHGKTKHVRSSAKAARSALASGSLLDSKLSKDINDDTLEEVDCIEEDDCKKTMEERMAMGLLVVTQEETRVAIKVCYVIEYGEPDEDDWSSAYLMRLLGEL